MEMFLLFASYLVLVNIVTLVDSSGVSAPSNSQWHKVTIDQWDSLNAQVGGRLHLQLPFAAECFTKVNERPNVVDIDSCTAIQANYTDRCEFVSRVAQPGAYMDTVWETCQTNNANCLLDASTPNNTAAFLPPRVCSQGSVPLASIQVQTYDDVIAALRFVRLAGIPLVVKNTGHDYKGRSSAPNSLALWMHEVQHTSYDPSFVPDGCHQSFAGVTYGAGQTFGDLYEFADKYNLTVLGGNDPTVGAAGGWLQAGGHGFLSNTLGLGVDRALQFRIVTAEGNYLTANECQNKDLFWALRGGGGGTFGVVMEATVLASSKVPIQVGVVTFKQNLTTTRALWSLMLEKQAQWTADGWGGLVTDDLAIYVNPTLNASKAADSLKDLIAFGRSLGDQATAVLLTELPSYLSFFEQFVASRPEAVGVSGALVSRLIPAEAVASSATRSDLLDAMIESLNNTSDIRIFSATSFGFSRKEGSTSITEVWGSALFHLVVGKIWDWNSTKSDRDGFYRTLTSSISRIRSLTPDAAYQNEADIHEPNHEVSFWGKNYAKLLEIKKKYDPDSLFECWQCVGWNARSPRYACYP